MRRLLMFAVVVLCVSHLAGAQGRKFLAIQEPDPAHPPGPPLGVQLRRSVVLINLECMQGGKLYKASGTGFVVAYMEDPRLAKDSHFDYLVTNRHVAMCWDDENHPMDVKTVSVRLNKKDGSSSEVSLSQNGNIHWYLPTEDSIDLAVSPITIGTDFEDLRIPLRDFATKEFMSANRIAEGAQIILSGYFYQFPGEHRFQPIVRQGILSMIPDEPVITTTGKRGNIYLGDVHIFHGNSGSPVLVSAQDGVLRMGEYHFLGVVSGYYYEDENFRLQIARAATPRTGPKTRTVNGTIRSNSGVAMIVPADELKDILENNADLKKSRDNYFKAVGGMA